MPDCNTEEILRQLKELDMLKSLKGRLGDPEFLSQFPELSSIGIKLDTLIEKTEATLNDKMGDCGNLNVDELPDTTELEGLSPLPAEITSEI